MHFLVMFPRDLSPCVFILPTVSRECREEKKEEAPKAYKFPAGTIQLSCLELLRPGVSPSVVCEPLVSLHDIGQECWGWHSRVGMIASSLWLFGTLKFKKPWLFHQGAVSCTAILPDVSCGLWHRSLTQMHLIPKRITASFSPLPVPAVIPPHDYSEHWLPCLNRTTAFLTLS